MAGYEQYTYFIMATDPLHLGTGGYRIGRVDNSILRDPSTNLPKVPGSSISGVTRNYAIWNASDEDKKMVVNCYTAEANGTSKGGCGKCKICKVFGYSSEEKNLMGSVKFFDAQIVFFLVMTLMGPKWITTAEILKEQFNLVLDPIPEREHVRTGFDVTNDRLNLGWIYLEASKLEDAFISDTNWPTPLGTYKEKMIVVYESLFSTLINMNLEVRTSVRIDPNTGSAKDKALFTYEAIPRTTLLAFDIIYENYRAGNGNADASIQASKDLVESGMALLNVMGIGGMNTRGFGRVKKIHEIER